MKNIVTKITCIIFIIHFFYSCNKKEFEGTSPGIALNYKNITAQFCEPVVEKQETITLTYFLTDTSASQILNDRFGDRRFTGPYDYVNSIEASSLDRFSLVTFSDDGQMRIPRANRDDFATALDLFWTQRQWQDIGFSLIPSGINKITADLIKWADMEKFNPFRKKADVIIYLLSDGYPQGPAGPLSLNEVLESIHGADGKGGLLGLLKSTRTQEYFNEIVIHTAYYWGEYRSGDQQFSIPEDPANEALMKEIARVGRGTALTFKDGTVPDLNQFLPLKTQLQRNLVSYFVRPIGILWETVDGVPQMVPDTDYDGLSDNLENTLGSDINNRDTDSDGILDGVSYRTTQKACSTDDCSKAVAYDPFYQSNLLPNGIPADSDGDGIDDANEIKLASDKFAPDSNENYYPDKYEFYDGNNLVQKNTMANDGDGDGISDYIETKQFLPPRIHNELISAESDKLGMIYKLEEVSKNNQGGSCYKLKVEKIPVALQNNEISITLVYQNTVMNSNTFFYEATVNLDSASNLSTKDFKQMLSNRIASP